MRSINWNNVIAQSDGEFQRLPAGPYVCRIVAMQDVPDREYVSMVYDIAEGKHMGYYSDNWGQTHPNAHRVVLSYKERALGMLKGRLDAIAMSNPGFDPFAAWDAGRLDMFTNRIVGLNLREEEYEWDGETKVRMSAFQVVDAARVRSGEIKPAPRKTLDNGTSSGGRPGGGRTVGVQQQQVYAGPVPFD